MYLVNIDFRSAGYVCSEAAQRILPSNIYRRKLWLTGECWRTGSTNQYNQTGLRSPESLVRPSMGLRSRIKGEYNPNPDFYAAFLFHKIMGDAVFSTAVQILNGEFDTE